MTQFSDLPRLVLGPLEGLAADAWTGSVDGKWTPGEIVAHLALVMDRSASGFESRAEHAPMKRRPGPMKQRIARQVVLKTGWFPKGRKAPDGTAPPAQPDRAETEARFRSAVDRFLALEKRLLPARGRDLFLKHPVLGDLTLPEFMRFHVVHGEHHARQIQERLRQTPRR